MTTPSSPRPDRPAFTTILLGLAAAIAIAAAGCGKDPDAKGAPAAPPPAAKGTPPPLFGDSPPPTAASPADTARQVYAASCVTCHGPRGRGDGAAAGALPVRPQDFGDAAWQASVTDEQLHAAIRGGGGAVGKSPAMPARPDLSDEVIGELVKMVRGFQQ